MKNIVSLIVCIAFTVQLAQCQCNFANKTFKPGEKVEYDVYYNLGFLWFNAAYANFEVSDTVINKMEAYHFKSFGTTLDNYDWIYKVRDHFESYADANTLSPISFSRNTSEGSFKVSNYYTFNSADQTIYSSIENTHTPRYNDTLINKVCTFDVLTAIYACRNFNVSQIKLNDTLPLTMIIDNKIYHLYLRYLGKENTELEKDMVYRCLKFSILLVEGTIFSGGEDLTVWISDDKAKVPIKVEAKILVGSIIAKLSTIKGNKWPLNSLINNKPSESRNR